MVWLVVVVVVVVAVVVVVVVLPDSLPPFVYLYHYFLVRFCHLYYSNELMGP